MEQRWQECSRTCDNDNQLWKKYKENKTRNKTGGKCTHGVRLTACASQVTYVCLSPFAFLLPSFLPRLLLFLPPLLPLLSMSPLSLSLNLLLQLQQQLLLLLDDLEVIRAESLQHQERERGKQNIYNKSKIYSHTGIFDKVFRLKNYYLW